MRDGRRKHGGKGVARFRLYTMYRLRGLTDVQQMPKDALFRAPLDCLLLAC